MTDLNKMLNAAIIMATKAHWDQTTRDGKAYILHPLHVMNNVNSMEAKIVAVLHDVVEDTDVDLVHIRHAFNDFIANTVDLVTRQAEQSYSEFISRIISHSNQAEAFIAATVKMADLTHNMDLSRLSTVSQSDLDRNNKYKKAYRRLEEFVQKMSA